MSLDTLNTYDSLGRLVKTSVTGQADTIYVYDDLGNVIRSGLDVDGNGTLDLASNDRISESDVSFVKIGSDWWKQSLSRVYPTANDGTPVTVGISRSRLTGFASGTVAESVSIDIYGNQTTSVTTLDRTAKTVTQTTAYPDSSVAAQTVTVNGLATSARSKSNLTTTFGYDALGRRTSVTDPRTGTSTVAYFTDTNGKKGKVQSVTDAANKTTTYDYDTATGRRTSVLNALGKYTRFAYNSYGQTTRVWGDTDYPVEAVFNSLGQQTELRTYRTGSSWNSATWPGENETPDVTSWTYDASSGLVTAKTDAASKSTAYTYSNDGKLATRTWARLSGGQPLVTTYGYNSATGELTSVDYSDSTTDLAYTYNRLGQTATVTDAAGSRTFTYNANLTLESETVPYILNGNIRHTYDTFGRRNNLQLRENDTVKTQAAYSFDSYGRLAGVTDSVNSAVYTRNANDQLSNLAIANTAQSRTYDTLGRLTSIGNHAYEYDDIGRRTKLTDNNDKYWNFSYNDKNEVTGGSKYNADNTLISGYAHSYSFDPIGNRLSASFGGKDWTYSINSLNQYSSVNSTNPTATENPSYDNDGNIQTRSGWTQVWNAENRMVSIENTNTKIDYVYDYLGRRIIRTEYAKGGVSGLTLVSTEKYVYDKWNCIAQYDAENALVKSWMWGEDLSGSMDGAGGVGGLLAETNTDGTYFPTYDGNGNIRSYQDSTGATVAAYEYDPFGRIIGSTGSKSTDFTYTFSTKTLDRTTGLVYYIYRDYDPILGRWTSRDPIEEKGGHNLYAMVGNNVTNITDSLGYADWGDLGHAMGVTPNYLAQQAANLEAGNPEPNFNFGSSTSVNVTFLLVNHEFVNVGKGCTQYCMSWTTSVLGVSGNASAGTAKTPLSFYGGLDKNLSVSGLDGTVGMNGGFGIGSPYGGSIRIACFRLTEKDEDGCPCPEVNNDNSTVAGLLR